MEKYFVYEIINLMGTVEYVGETKNPYNRWKLHKCNSKSSGSGKFHKRSDVFMNIVCEFDNKHDAFNYQCELQNYYGFKTDREKISQINLGRKNSEETRLKISKSNLGRKNSEESKLKMSKSRKGKVPWNKGLKQTEEHLNKRIKALTGKKYKQNLVN